MRNLLLFVCIGAPAAAQVSGPIDVWPANSTVEVGKTKQYGAYVPISPNTITWAVNGVVGGNAMTGTITAGGLYTAPAVAPTPGTVVIRAQSVPFPGTYKETNLTVIKPYPWLWSVSPSSVSVGTFTISLNGSNFAPDSEVLINGVPVAMKTYSSPTKLIATGTAAAPGVVTVAVRQPAPGQVTGNSVSLTVASAPISVTVAPASVSVLLGASQAFAAAVTGSANTAVTWTLTGAGSITSAGVYTAPFVMPANPSATVRATSAADPTKYAQAMVAITAPPSDPPPGGTPPPSPSGLLTAARLLEQSSFGPKPATIAEVQQLGAAAYLDAQFAMPETPIPLPADNSMGTMRQWMLQNYINAPDQLRQRVAYSLSQILVTSANKLIYPNENVPWLRLLSQHAFGNYRTLLKDVTMSPSMGKFLDLANSAKPGLGSGANENYPRELLQLFSIGLWKLNPDGTQQLSGGLPISTYDQNTVKQVSLALTGWTYPTAPGATPQNFNWEYFGAPMESRQANHDTSAKSFLGCNLPAGQTVMQDLDATIDCVFNHPNTPPFIAQRLIRLMVTSNPAPAYVQRVAAVFENNGQGVRGDLKAVVKAMLLDAEARMDTPTTNYGRLREPVLQISTLIRALNGSIAPQQSYTYVFDDMAQSILNPPSVFNWYSLMYRIPKSTLSGPEFQIYTAPTSVLRANFMYQLLSGQLGQITIDLAQFQPYGNDVPGLVEKVNQVLLFGRMPLEVRQAIETAAAPGYDANQRIQTAVFLTALSGQFAVQQ